LKICCIECLNNDQYQRLIIDNVFLGNCSYCGESHKLCFNMDFIIYKLTDEAINRFVNLNIQIMNENRYFIDFEFGEILTYASKYYSAFVASDTMLYRSRLGGKKSDISLFEIDEPFPLVEMMNPDWEITPDGRANPFGVPYLYTSMERETSICELRPWMSAKISLITFSLNRELQILDLTNSFILPHQYIDPQNLHDVIPNCILNLFSSRLSYPVDPSSLRQSYLITQYFSEFVKKSGYKGLKYKSSISDGNNLVLFVSVGKPEFEGLFDFKELELYSAGRASYEYSKQYGRQLGNNIIQA
jgi:hypothetical protein